MTSSSDGEAEMRRDIVAELTNSYFETYRDDRPNDSVEELTAFAHDLAENDIDELLAAHRQAAINELLDELEVSAVNGFYTQHMTDGSVEHVTGRFVAIDQVKQLLTAERKDLK